MHDFIENFFESLQEEFIKQDNTFIPRERLISTIMESSMAEASKEQLLDYMKGFPDEVNLYREACEFL